MVGKTMKLINHGFKYSSIVTMKEVLDDHDGCRLKLMNEPSDPRDSGGGYANDNIVTGLSYTLFVALSLSKIYHAHCFASSNHHHKLE